MNTKHCIIACIVLSGFLAGMPSCKDGNSKPTPAPFSYQQFKDSLKMTFGDTAAEGINVLDGKDFNPATDSLDQLLMKLDTIWDHDMALLQQVDTFIKDLKKGNNFTPEEIQAIKENRKMLDSFLLNRNNPDIPNPCSDTTCLIFADVRRSVQKLFLYIGGELKDSFPVSTGMRKFETPDINTRPHGPLFIKYISKKFPGGNYQGLGNMPYAVFIRGGYAIHGTTKGNFSKLGKPASHGCIRLHPDNARIFYELVKRIGLGNTWVMVRK